MSRPFTDPDVNERIENLERRLEMFADFLLVDLGALDILTSSLFANGIAIDWYAEQLAHDAAELRAYLDRGETMPPCADARGKTLRRWLLLERERDRQ